MKLFKNTIYRLFLWRMIILLILAHCGSPFKKQSNRQDSPHSSQTIYTDDNLDRPSQVVSNNNSAPNNTVPEIAMINLSKLITEMNLQSYYKAQSKRQWDISQIKIAILDNGFLGLENSLGKHLPHDLKVEAALKNDQQDSVHGTLMAEMVYSIATGKNRYDPNTPGPKLLLYNTNGFTNFSHAIDQVINNKVDIVLYSQVWLFGSNFDGKGFINQLVNRAIANGVVWINAVGNYGKATYFTEFDQNGNFQLPHNNQYVRFQVTQDETPVRIVLTWNDFSDSINYFSAKDLDLYLEAANGQALASSTLVQDGVDHNNTTGFSRYARELINKTLTKGTYYLKVVKKSQNFNSQSKLKITVSGDMVEILGGDRTEGYSTNPPADNPFAISVGATDVEYSSSGFFYEQDNSNQPFIRYAPLLNAPSQVEYNIMPTLDGSSNAAALAAGAIALALTAYGKLPPQQMHQLIENGILNHGAEHKMVIPSGCVNQSDRTKCNPMNGYRPAQLFLKPLP